MTMLLVSICDKIETMTRDFVCGKNEHSKKPYLIAWKNLSTSNESGGAGLRNIKAMNQTMLMKLGWDLIYKKDDIWMKVIKAKYKCGSDIIPRVNRKPEAFNLWRRI